MDKRKPFFIKGNFQLKFIICFIVLLALCISLATLFIYCQLKTIIGDAAFSSHLSLASSGELFWHTILEVNFAASCISLGIISLVIIILHFYLQAFFHYLAGGIDRLGKGEFSFRLKEPRIFGRRLLRDFNNAARNVDRDASKTEELIKSLIEVIDALGSGKHDKLKDLKSLNNKLQQKFEK